MLTTPPYWLISTIVQLSSIAESVAGQLFNPEDNLAIHLISSIDLGINIYFLLELQVNKKYDSKTILRY